MAAAEGLASRVGEQPVKTSTRLCLSFFKLSGQLLCVAVMILAASEAANGVYCLIEGRRQGL